MIAEWNSPEEIERDNAMIRRFREYWESLNNGMPPERCLIDLEAIKEVLPYILLVEFEHAPFRVRLRLTGTTIDAATGYNLTNRYLDEFLVEPFKVDLMQVLEAYERVARTGQPYIGSYLQWPVQVKVPYGIFPLLVDGEPTQAITVEQPYGPLPVHETKTWKDYLAIHAAGGAI